MSQAILKTILTSLDSPLNASFTFDDVIAWPEHVVDVLVSSGILKRGGNAQTVTCDGCGEGCVEDVEFSRDRDGSLTGYVICRERDDMGRIRIAPERLRTWEVSFSGLASVIVGELGGNECPEESLPGRLWWLGRTSVNGCSADTFLARGARWPGAKSTFSACDRLNECFSPLVLVPDRTGQRNLFGEFTTVASLTRVLSLEDRLIIDTSAIMFGDKTRTQDLDSIFRHSSDFRSVCLRDREFGLTTNQARVVECLHTARMNNTPDVSQEHLLVEVLNTNQERLKDVFRSLKNWEQLIVPGKTKGTYRLNH